MQWITLFKKEMVENWRNFKWIWVPLVITFLAIMDPITIHFMPAILDTVGGLPEGAIFEMPDPHPLEVIMMSIGQLSSLGVLIITFMSMGTIAGEIKSGVSEIVLVKPISYLNYITSKWVSLILLVFSSLVIAFTANWYYVNLLFGKVTIGSLGQIIFFYGLWFAFVITLVIFFSTLFKTPGLVAAATIGTSIILGIISSFFGKYLTWSPNKLSEHLQQSLVSNEISFDLWMTSMITIILIAILVLCANILFNKRELIRDE